MLEHGPLLVHRGQLLDGGHAAVLELEDEVDDRVRGQDLTVQVDHDLDDVGGVRPLERDLLQLLLDQLPEQLARELLDEAQVVDLVQHGAGLHAQVELEELLPGFRAREGIHEADERGLDLGRDERRGADRLLELLVAPVLDLADQGLVVAHQAIDPRLEAHPVDGLEADGFRQTAEHDRTPAPLGLAGERLDGALQLDLEGRAVGRVGRKVGREGGEGLGRFHVAMLVV